MTSILPPPVIFPFHPLPSLSLLVLRRGSRGGRRGGREAPLDDTPSVVGINVTYRISGHSSVDTRDMRQMTPSLYRRFTHGLKFYKTNFINIIFMDVCWPVAVPWFCRTLWVIDPKVSQLNNATLKLRQMTSLRLNGQSKKFSARILNIPRELVSSCDVRRNDRLPAGTTGGRHFTSPRQSGRPRPSHRQHKVRHSRAVG